MAAGKHLPFLALLLGAWLFLVSGCAPKQQPAATPLPSSSPLPSPVLTSNVEEEPSPTLPPSPSPSATPSPEPPPAVARPLFGAEIRTMRLDEEMMHLLVSAGVQVVRYNGILWNEVEPQPGQVNWEALASLETGLEKLSEAGIDTILVVRGAPYWAQKIPGRACGPIAEDQLPAFADFMAELVRRYSLPPYNVRYWELGNEPDVDGRLVPPNSVFGCWGDETDAFYGGGEYAGMLEVVYPAMKAANPDIVVLNGGLLLDCDPEHPQEGKTCLAGRFWEGILQAGGGEYLDGVSFHGYPFYIGSLQMDTEHPAWHTRGGVVMGKIAFLRDLMHQYGVDKPLFLTETSLLCPEWNPKHCSNPGEDFYTAQADYIVRTLTRVWAAGVEGTIWYQFEGQGWRYSGMVGENLAEPHSAFEAFRFFNAEMKDMLFVEELSLTPGVAAYKFISGDRRQEIWVLWSVDGEEHYVALPMTVVEAYDELGNPVPFTDYALDVSSAVYVVLSP